MDVATDPVAVVARLRDEPWDRKWNSLEVAGVDLVSLDTRLGGCAHTWVANSGCLHERGMSTVRLVLDQLERVMPELTEDDSPAVWHRLHETARLIAAHNTPPADQLS
ncbi:hypothetical protein [Streptomyces toxytricini]|uniref:hypothetical protein n=1 Tax=Streptomyces toxytricini TaxID=67369 RepID=UPI00343EE192